MPADAHGAGRADAKRNRQRIIAAALEAFSSSQEAVRWRRSLGTPASASARCTGTSRREKR